MKNETDFKSTVDTISGVIEVDSHGECKSKFNSLKIQMRTIYDFRSSNINQLKLEMMNFNWDVVLHENEIDIQFHSIMTDMINVCVPQHQVAISANDKDWIMPITKHYINKRWEAVRHKDWPRYEHFKEKVKIEIKKSRAIWAGKLKRTTNGMWKLENAVNGKGHSKIDIRSLLKDYDSEERVMPMSSPKISTSHKISINKEARTWTIISFKTTSGIFKFTLLK